MRDLAKSMLRCSLAVSVLGAREAASLLTGNREGSMRTFDALSHAAEDQMGEAYSSFFRAGEHLQSGMLETMSELASGSWSDPAGALNRGMRQGWATLDRSWSSLRGPR